MEITGEKLEINAAKAGAHYINKLHTDISKEYNLILIGSGDVGPERRMMKMLKDKGYRLKNLWLVDIKPPTDEIIQEIKDNYTHYVHCLNFPQMKKILIQSGPSLFEHTYLLGIHFAITYFGLTDMELAKEFLKIHKDPWLWEDFIDIPRTIQPLLKEPITDQRVQEEFNKYYKQWMTDMGMSKELQDLALHPMDPKSSRAVFQVRTQQLISPLIGNEIGEFFYYWVVWFKKSVGFAWRGGKICTFSEKDLLPEMLSVSYVQFFTYMMDGIKTRNCFQKVKPS